VLGYDPDASRPVLKVNEGEAEQVREIFAMFLRHGSLGATLEAIQARGWGMKSWTTRKGRVHAGRPFDRPALERLLSNVLYCGEVKYQGKIYPGEEGEKVCIPVAKPSLTEQVPPPRVEPAPGVAPTGRLPRITRLLALAVRFEDLLRNGTARDYAELARLGGVSRSRITQIMNLRRLAPALQERILWLPASSSAAGVVTERVVRRLTQCLDWREQIKMFEELCDGRVRES